MESPLGSPVIADASRHGLQRSHTRAAISMGQDVGSLTDARHKQDSTAKSFNSLMTLQASEAEKEAQRKKYNDQASMYRAQIERQRRCTLDPHGRWMSRWDMLTSLALLFTATITPFEVCILEGGSLDEMARDPLAWINRVVDLIFITDVALNCFTTFQDQSAEGGASWVYDTSSTAWAVASGRVRWRPSASPAAPQRRRRRRSLDRAARRRSYPRTWAIRPTPTLIR